MEDNLLNELKSYYMNSLKKLIETGIINDDILIC